MARDFLRNMSTINTSCESCRDRMVADLKPDFDEIKTADKLMEAYKYLVERGNVPLEVGGPLLTAISSLMMRKHSYCENCHEVTPESYNGMTYCSQCGKIPKF